MAYGTDWLSTHRGWPGVASSEVDYEVPNRLAGFPLDHEADSSIPRSSLAVVSAAAGPRDAACRCGDQPRVQYG